MRGPTITMSNGYEDAIMPSPPPTLVNGIAETKNESNETTLAHNSIHEPVKPASSFDSVELTNKALKFLSKASNETLGGIAVSLAACTYLVLGRIGLVLIGALGGVVLHASWEEYNATPGAAEDARRAKGLDIVRRVLDLRDTKDKEEVNGLGEDGDITGNGFEKFRPEIATSLNELTDAVIRDYVKWWYDPILPNEATFPSASRATFTSFLVSMSNHLSRKRPADTFLDFLTNSTSIFIVFLNELSHAFSTSSNSSKTAAEVVYEYLASNPDSNLANVLNEKLQQKKFQMAADDLLQNFLDKSVYNCGPARVFLQQTMANLVLETALQTCSKPEWINGWIVYLLEEGETELMEAIDAGVSTPVDGFDGNVGNISLAKPIATPTESKLKLKKTEEKKHKKRLSKAEEAMEEAMEEAKRLSQLIAEDDAKKSPSEIPDSKVLGLPTVIENPNSPYPLESPYRSMSNGHFNEAKEGSISPVTASDLASPRTPSSNTTFDQILPKINQEKSALTLHNATITIYDDSAPGDKGKIRSKPTTEYMLQIEPESSQHPGWMIPRKYADFEPLHEVLRRIAAISGVTAFTEQHSSLPHWKGHTKSSFRGELERYLRDACWYQPLAESEGMRRFLEKDRGYSNESKEGFAGIGWPTPQTFGTMGKGVIDVLASAPKGAAEGGKAVFGGVSGVITNIGSLGNNKKSPNSAVIGINTAGRTSMSSLSRMDSNASMNGIRGPRSSEDSLRITSPIVVATQPPVMPQMERRPSYNSNAESENEAPAPSRLSFSARSSISGRGSRSASRDPSQGPSMTGMTSPILGRSYEDLNLPPPPSDMPDDYGSRVPGTPTSIGTAPSFQSPQRNSTSSIQRPIIPPLQASAIRQKREPLPLSIQETNVAVELIFAVINELYTLSSAWNIRRTLLNAAKTFLLRPGNPSLISIQTLIQDDIIASNTSDSGIAAHLRKLRENTLPTVEERKAWPEEMTMEEKERLRIKARKLLVERGVPAALTGVMGQAATAEAMGRVFDCLQVEEVARGLICGVLLQGVRAVTH